MSFRRIISQQLVHISQEFSKSLVKLFSQLKTAMIKVLPFFAGDQRVGPRGDFDFLCHRTIHQNKFLA